ncbi:oligo alginate lyase [Paenibacillus sp. J31TS4]|uniref:DUF4962 domain-containing protein n=1 Tax=Paenibacillus sp. J31TS4 TaxID=2807195 RepID=UPI001B2825BD|nr:DUF4962 domain-containing protein [Paenibacillus sp. J31TS4]GIP37236.1 oligo alginate lyase [Paenibacillus sp. J31TS4]
MKKPSIPLAGEHEDLLLKEVAGPRKEWEPQRKLFEPRSGPLTVRYQPDEQTVLLENPPRFTWMAAKLEFDRYMLQLSETSTFDSGHTLEAGPLAYPMYTPERPLSPGRYYWRYALLETDEEGRETGGRTEWSTVRTFVVPGGLPETPLPGPESRYAGASLSHPRLWLQGEKLDAFRERVRTDPEGSGWRAFYEGSVLPWTRRALIPEPSPYPEHRRVAKLWRQMYMDCQETLYAIRHLSIAAVVLQDEELLGQAKRWLLHAADWDPDGTTSRDYNDEAAFRIAAALAWGYDWLHAELSQEERDRVRASLLRRTRQVAHHVIERSRIHQVPYDSHAVRSLSSVLTPCCIALLEEVPEARRWLDYTVDSFWTLYSPWGGGDGGWAEGPMYWTTGMAFVTEAMNLLKSWSGLDLYKRPFFRRTGDFPLYCYPPDTLRASFGDQSNLGEGVSLKTGFNIRQFAGVTGSGLYQWYYERTAESDRDADSKFYNYGWWDFRFDDMMYRHDYPSVQAVSPEEIEPVKWFRDVGWVAMHHRMDDPAEHIFLLAKSSPYGSLSHSHGDQNAFLLHAYGEPLAIESGYYIAFGSTMHRRWRRQTRSKNAILIDGKGQYAETDKVRNIAASGKVVEAGIHGAVRFAKMDATAAYREEVPYLDRYVREIYMVADSSILIVDQVDLTQAGSVQWLLHTLYRMRLGEQRVRVVGQQADMDVRFVYCSSGELTLRQEEGFPDVDPSEVEGLPAHWHLTAETRSARSHRIAALLVPMKKEEDRYVSHFLDDQDHGIHLYLTADGETHRFEIPKAY